MKVMIKPRSGWLQHCRNTSDIWYKPGEVFEVEPYRHNSIEYWEIKGWDDACDWNGGNYWIIKKHTIPYFEIPPELFEL